LLGGALTVCLARLFKGCLPLDDADEMVCIDEEAELVVESESDSSLEDGGSLDEGLSPQGFCKSSTSIIAT
jgi:hypothetical protein